MESQSNSSSYSSPAAAFEATLWANGLAESDPFHTASINSSKAPPGTTVEGGSKYRRLQVFLGSRNRHLAHHVPDRKIAVETSSAAEAIPASAYVLWP